MRQKILLSLTLALITPSAFGTPPLTPCMGLKNKHHDCGTEQEALLKDGRIWIRRYVSPQTDWELFGETGLPQSGLIFRHDIPITEISTDGDNLLAVSWDGKVHYAKLGSRKWAPWGRPFRRSLSLPRMTRAYAISHRGAAAGGYEDIHGQFNPVSIGNTALYALSDDGRTIQLADPWLPSRFRYLIPGPERGRFTAVNLDASASTIFVIDAAGRMYTRLADYDTLGQNPFLTYTYERGGAPNARALPAEDWFRQPDIQGFIPGLIPPFITAKISIFQIGRGNSARLLRVQGMNILGQTGYFEKKIFDPEWNFVPTSEKITEPFLNPNDVVLGPNLGSTLSGTIRIGNKTRLFTIDDFNPDLMISTIQVMDDEAPLQLTLHTVRREYFSSLGSETIFRGAVLGLDRPIEITVRRVKGKYRIRSLDGRLELH